MSTLQNVIDIVVAGRAKKVEAAVDQLRKRFGQDVIMRASFLPKGGREIDHMGGGISREKRTVDYSKIKNDVRDVLGKFFYKETEAKPMIITVIQEV